jgi:hypothetical protein
MPGLSDDPDALPAFDYFVLRLARTAGNPPRLSGMIERLGSGDKHRFETWEQLRQLIARSTGLQPDRPDSLAR